MTPVERARSVVGTRFRRQGRGGDGFDCVGLVGWAHGVAVPADYPGRCGDAARVAAVLADAGFRQVAAAAAGDVLLLRSGPGQLHLGLSTGAGIIHADAVARRVVERRDVPWPVVSIWQK
ncbi:C40 family peptidase [Sphingomonas lacusdianchii]|uniref:C40 family peptidase n=1 Tax=Sphingomonas lacusdianchii TaxID=2917992 RepID=UPI001F5A1D42|nr:C40 family peptidase [Sphingomonas sp. JXJ CY 53]